MENNELTSTIRRVVMAADEDGTFLTADIVKGWPDDALDLFDHIGIIARGNNASGVFCSECDDRCWVEPDYRKRRNETVLVHCCENRDDTGYVYHSLDALDTWRINLNEFAREISQTLDLNGEIKEIEKNRLWSLGNMLAGKKTRRFYLGRGFHFDDAKRLAGIADEHHDADSFLFVFDRKPSEETWRDPAGSIISLADVVSIKEGELILDSVEIDRILKKKKSTLKPFDTPPDASWEKVVIRVLPPEDGEEESTRVELQVGRRKETRTFIEMGMFDDRKNPREPSNAWTLLLILAQNGGELGWSDKGASDKARSHMNILRNCLRAVFQIKGIPISDYKKEKIWKTVFILTDLRNAP